MEERERRMVLEQLAASRGRLMELVEGLTAEQWAFRPAEGRWSIGECIEHVTRVENRIYGVIVKKLEEGVPSDQLPDRQKDALIMKAIPDRTVKRQAPEAARPTGQWADESDVLAEFEKTRLRTMEFAATTTGDLRRHFHAHMALGEIDCYQWLLVLSLHGSRHAQQIEEIRAASNFPGARPLATGVPASA
jgi:uncharacterized damage-inducible protein DinB